MRRFILSCTRCNIICVITPLVGILPHEQFRGQCLGMSIIWSVCLTRHRYWIVDFEIRSGRRWNNVTIHRGEICVACLLDPNVQSICPRMSTSDPCPHFPWYVQVPIALYGFVIAATWIDFIADHLVALLEFLGIVARIPNYIMGLTVSDEFVLNFICFLSYVFCAENSTQSRTCCFLNTCKVLAWGNSMPNLSGNVTMARKGLANMAITACFAGPVFNILVGLGCGFGVLRHATGNENTFDSCNQDRVCVLSRQLRSTSGYQVGHQ